MQCHKIYTVNSRLRTINGSIMGAGQPSIGWAWQTRTVNSAGQRRPQSEQCNDAEAMAGGRVRER